MAPTNILTLTREEYLARVRAALPSIDSENADHLIARVALHLGTPEDEERIRQGMKAFLLDPEEGYAGLLKIYDLAQVRHVFTQSKLKLLNWHFDRRARVLLVNLRRGVHESLSAALFRAYADAPEGVSSQESEAEYFLIDGLGWFKSATSLGAALRGQDTVLDAQERMAFRDVQFQVLNLRRAGDGR